MNFAKICTFNGLKYSGSLKEFSITSEFLGSKIQKSIFEVIMGFECICQIAFR